MNFTPTREGPRVNEEISVMRVRLVDERGQMVGVVGRNEALDMATDAGLRAVTDTGNEKISYKVREHSLAKVPLILAVGRREAEQRSVSLRRLGSPAQEALALSEAIARLKVEAVPPGSH